jgi:hypothetical protein
LRVTPGITRHLPNSRPLVGDPALRYKLARIVIVGLAGDKAAAVNPDRDRTAAVLLRLSHLGKYIQI